MHEIKTLGWTISEWQTAYLNNQIQLDTLKDLVAAIDPQDNAWISIATVAQIEQQIQALNLLKYRAESDCLNTPFAILKLSSLKFLPHAFYESHLVYKFG